MAISSLIVRIGVKDEELQKALASVGAQAKTVDDKLKALGETPVGQQAIKSLEQMQKSMKAVTDSYRGLADRAVNAARGIEIMGGVSKLTSDDLAAMNRTVAKGIDAFRALGQDAPANLVALAAATKGAGSEWEKFVKGFDIEQAIANPMATAKQAILAFTETLGATAIAAAAVVTAVVAVGIAIFKLATDAAEVGGNLDDMADKTGMSVPALSRLQNAAAVAGTNLNTLTDAVFKVEQRMGEGGAEWDKALAKMGLSTEALRAAGPDNLLQLLAAGLGGIQDPADRAATGVALMGKGAGGVVPVLADLNAAFALTNDITPWTTAQAADAEKFQMQIASLVVHAEALGTALGRDLIPFVSGFVSVAADVASVLAPLVGQFSGITSVLNTVTGAWENAAAAIEVFRGVAAKLPPITGDAAKGVDKWKQSVSGLALAVPTLTAALITEEFATKDLTARHGELTKAQDAAAAAAKKAAEDHRKFTDSVISLTSSAVGARQAFGPFGVLMQDLSGIALEHMARLDALTSSYNEFHNGLTVAGDEIATVTIPLFSALPNVVAQATDKIREVTAATATLGDTLHGSLTTALSKIPDLLVKAFEGGGGLKGAIKAIGVTISEAILQPLIAKLSSLQKAAVSAGSGIATALGGATGGGTGAAIAGIASSLGGAALAASSWGTSMAAAGAAGTVALSAATLGIGAAAVGIYLLIKHWGAAEKQVNKTRQAFVDAAGGLDALNAHAQAAGVTLDKLLAAKNAPAFNAALADLTNALAIFDAKAHAATSAVSDLLGIVQTTGGLIPESLKPAIQKLIDMKLVTGDVAAEFARLAGNTDVDFKTLSAIASKYGADLTKLGPAFEAARLHDLSAGIVNDFDTLTRGLGSADEALRIMKKPINDLVNDSLKAGLAIPENFKPWIEQLALTGQLTDVNGDKITDLSKLQFAPPIVSEFDKIVAKLQELIDKIGTTLPNALNNIPSPPPVHVPVVFDIPNLPSDYGAHGGLVTAHGIQHMARGGRILPFLARGTDTVPAMLTPGERVLTVQETQAYEAGGGTTIMQRGMSTAVLEHKLDQLQRQMAQRDRLLPKQIRDAILLAGRAG